MSSPIPIYQIDAFADQAFKGNPAAICLLEREYEDDILLNIAKEMNLSETAFIYCQNVEDVGNQNRFRLRWFTPKAEVKLCGHATLASAGVLFYELNVESTEVVFETLSGELIVKKDGNQIVMDFPRSDLESTKVSDDMLNALGLDSYETAVKSEFLEYLLIQVADENIVQNLQPNFEQMLQAKIDYNVHLVIVTAKSKDYDFISRCFAPWFNIPEDPVTGSAHTLLQPFWAQRLQKNEMRAFQASFRGGELVVRSKNNRVELVGQTRLVLKGKFFL